MHIQHKELVFFRTASGHIPFQKWFASVKDVRAQALIKARLDRLMVCHYGDYKCLDSRLYELRIDYGPGYRVYFAELRSGAALLLLGGIKRTQRRDISRAVKHWHEFKQNYES